MVRCFHWRNIGWLALAVEQCLQCDLCLQSCDLQQDLRQHGRAAGVPDRALLFLVDRFVRGANSEISYAPARPLDQITAYDVIKAMREGQGDQIATKEEATKHPIQDELDLIFESEKRVASSLTLETLVHEADKAIHTDAPAPP